jgi:hypothetical protein
MEKIGGKKIIDKKIEELVKKWGDKGMENYWSGFSGTELEMDLRNLVWVVAREIIEVLKK